MACLGVAQSSLKALLTTQRYAVLATADRDRPHASLMAFAATEDGKQVVLATEKNTRKCQNLKANAHVALLMDNRENRGSDTQQALAATILGNAEEVDGDERRNLIEVFLARHPHLRAFAESPSCAVIRVSIRACQVVTGLQDVVAWQL